MYAYKSIDIVQVRWRGVKWRREEEEIGRRRMTGELRRVKENVIGGKKERGEKR